MCWSQPTRVDHNKGRNFFLLERMNLGHPATPGGRTLVAHQPWPTDCWLPTTSCSPSTRKRVLCTGWRLAVARRPWLTVCQTTSWPPFFGNFFHFFSFFFCYHEDGLAFWENGFITPPFFEPCPYTCKCEIFHSSWSLEISFFSNFFAKIRRQLDLHIHHWDFSFMKKRNHQKFHKNC
jgi:hypothetical protein